MTGIYYADMLDVLRGAGCAVRENSITDGWQTRARSSGGFPSPPLCVFWHHTASSSSPENDLSYMIDGSDDAPVGNVLLDRTGAYWPIAAGASNCAGKGGPSTFSRGTIPVDSGNTRGFQIEAANNGVGEPWPNVQIDAYLAGSNALSAHFGNLPTDTISHAGYTSRKIDPATAAAVEGAWRPASANSSGTWRLDDIRSECSRRASSIPPPIPILEEDEVKHVIADGRGPMIVGAGWRHWARNEHEAGIMASLYGPPQVMSPGEYDVTSDVHSAPSDD